MTSSVSYTSTSACSTEPQHYSEEKPDLEHCSRARLEEKGSLTVPHLSAFGEPSLTHSNTRQMPLTQTAATGQSSVCSQFRAHAG